MKKVLVTGGNSYIGRHCVAQLLEKKYEVRITTRDKNKGESVKQDIEIYLKRKIELEIYQADLTKDDGWSEAVEGCDAIMHVAGPFPLNVEKGGEQDQIIPHEDGTIRLFEFAKKHGVSRIVLTSSVASAYMGFPGDKHIDETKWTDLNNPNIDAYTKSKVLAEKAAWKFAKDNDSINLTCILPPLVLGTGIGSPNIRGSIELIYKFINKQMPVAPPFKMGVVDVRDVAKAHIDSLDNEKTFGKRIIVAENMYWVKEICSKLNDLGHKAPTFSPPVFLVKFMANFDNTIKPIVPLLGLDMQINTDVAKSLLNFKPIAIEKTLKDTSDYLSS